MAVKIRLAIRGRKKLRLYDIVVAPQRAPRDGRFIEKVGNYNPNLRPSTLILREDRILKWLLEGAEPTDTVKSILSSQGILLKKHLLIGLKKGAISQEEVDQRVATWKAEKMNKKPKFIIINSPGEETKKQPELSINTTS